MDLQTYVSDDIDTVEIYICPSKVDSSSSQVPIGWSKPCKYLNTLGQGQSMKIKEFYHRDLLYTYDKDNDAQRVVQKRPIAESVYKHAYIVSSKEDVLPSHRFPCTNEIVHETDVERTSYRINNRMHVCHDKEGSWEYLYIRYNHSPNVDVKQMQHDLAKTLRKLGI